ncbi:nucleotidyltransferase domain-containing protein [Paraflavitalea pollutisoli]|uniref:nucleotidyltransferase domain-containing protein n=1 Tax=Paraflavitalea pollutisoli TaxID=3034143 RepID=UPI0023EC7A0A|nr:nucleotidyltransferase domain-containing protein [Paraflavitalea sp. H1-2-19X]
MNQLLTVSLRQKAIYIPAHGTSIQEAFPNHEAMRSNILERIDAIAHEQSINILFACESGSRGWQFPSPDSDYDVRFIYLRSGNDYLSVAGKTDDMSFPINDELDIHGWDLRKLLRLMLKSNTTPFEWIQSPIIYRQKAEFPEALWSLSQHYYSRRSNIHHYLGIASGARASFGADGRIGIKKLFYVLRPLLAAKWCLERNSIAPMTIGPLMELLPRGLREELSDLIALKADRPEAFLINVSALLKAFIDAEMKSIDEASKQLSRDFFDPGRLDDFFRQMLKQHDN